MAKQNKRGRPAGQRTTGEIYKNARKATENIVIRVTPEQKAALEWMAKYQSGTVTNTAGTVTELFRRYIHELLGDTTGGAAVPSGLGAATPNWIGAPVPGGENDKTT